MGSNVETVHAIRGFVKVIIAFYSFESGLFNGLQRIQIRFFPVASRNSLWLYSPGTRLFGRSSVGSHGPPEIEFVIAKIITPVSALSKKMSKTAGLS
jgi:hypothetical protein